MGERDVYYWCGGFFQAKFRHSLGPGAVRGISRRGRRKEVGKPSPPTISEGVSSLALSLTPYSNAWGYPTNFPLGRSPPGHNVASYAADPSAYRDGLAMPGNPGVTDPFLAPSVSPGSRRQVSVPVPIL